MVSLINFKTFGETGDLDDTRHVQLSDRANTKTSSSGKNNQDFSSKAPLNGPQHNSPLSSRKEHFEIRWTNLNYVVEPKWYQRDWRAALTGGGGPQQQQQKGAGTGAETGSSATTKGTTSILNSLRGSVKSGQVTAILGPSGAGKTSLLGCLTGKNKSGVSGCVQVISTNGGPGRMEPLSICTIPQKDYLLNQLTVRENLWFASRLKHPIDGFDHDSNIDRVVELLKLESCIDTKISKISGGQYKRVSIAQELLSNPDILILDEPTSGLDSLTCYKTVMVLRDLARRSPNPMAIIVTIHQPQREVFDLFNHVYILAVGGRCIYEGHPSQSIKTINECSGGLQFDADQYNPASYLVEIASVEFGEKPIEALVEHQRNEFTRKTNAQDHRNYLISGGGGGGADLADQQQRLTVGQFGANGSNLTPNLKKRSHSPMISRFKSTLSSLTGSASSPHISSLAMGRAGQMGENNLNLGRNSHKLPPLGSLTDGDSVAGGGGGGGAAYSNDAYESNQTLNELGLDNRQDQLSMNLNYINNNNSTNANNNAYADNSSRAPSDHLNHQNHQQRNGNNLRQQNLIYPETISVVASGDKQRDNNIVSNYTLDQKQQLSSVTPDDDGEFYLDTRLQTHKHNHKGHFLRHCQLLTKRSWLCLCKDPMLTTLRFSAHIIVPLLITLVYGSRVGKPNACPLYESEMDLIDYARRGAKRLLNLQDELRCTFENVGLYFLSIYAFTFSTMCLTSLSFPLSMHVLLKEVRNGWYSIPTFFIGKTLADFPLEFILPVLTLMITYPLTGQPSSYLEWRFILATGIFVVTSLIAQTQGLIFGALFMNAMQAAVFVAPVSTTPLILLSGFLIRISQMPLYLQKLSTLSYFRYAIESLTIIRYGFGQCECDPQVVNGKPVSASGVPDQLRTMTNYWLSTFDVATNDANSLEGSDYSTINETITDIITTTVAPSSLGANLSALATTTTSEPAQVDFFQDLTVLLARANSFGADIKTCKDLKPYPMIDFSLEDDQLYVWCAALVATLFLSKVVNYYVVKYSVKWRL